MRHGTRGRGTLLIHSLNAAAPLLNETEFVEYPANYSISQF